MGRAPCCEKVGLKRGRWTSEEDEILTKYIQTNGEGSWRSLPKNAGLLRCGKSCRLRWINYLRADLKRGNISEEEEEIIVKLHSSYGNRWSLIAGHLPGRTDNEIKNYWNSHLSRRIHTFRRFNGDGAPAVVEIGKVLGAPKRRRGRTSRSAMKRTLINVEALRREKQQEKGGGTDFATTPILDSLTNPLDEEREIAGAHNGRPQFTTDAAALGEERESGVSGLSYDALENEVPGPYEGAESTFLERESDLLGACAGEAGYLGGGVVGPTGEVTGTEILSANEEREREREKEKGASLAIQEEWMGWELEGMGEKLKEDEGGDKWSWLWETNNLEGSMEMEFELQNSYEAWLLSDQGNF